MKVNDINLIEVLRQTTTVTRFVLVILLIFSVWSWAIILSKLLLLRKINRESETFWKIFRRGRTLSEISTALETLRFTPLVPVFNAAAEKSGRASASVLQRVVQRASSTELTRLEKRMNFLATTASVAPFIGLFGTVWGVMTSFAGLANANTASLRAVAPGIADALVATAFGLFAAIPALIAYNHFVYQIRNLGGQLDELQTEILAATEERGMALEERTTV
jgi:biopolymer transport protein TolQ